MDSNVCGDVEWNDDLVLSNPGFRFHPTEEEIIVDYLYKKVLDSSFSALAIGEVDMTEVEPCELPWRAKQGDLEWYFFSPGNTRYSTYPRRKMATAEGFWKRTTKKQKNIQRGNFLIGTRSTLAFYKRRLGKSEKSKWVCHEYRLGGIFSPENLPNEANNDWVINKVYKKGCNGERVRIYQTLKNDSPRNEELQLGSIPPLTDLGEAGPSNKRCRFSNMINNAPAPQEGLMITNFFESPIPLSSSSSNSLEFLQTAPAVFGVQCPTVQPAIVSRLSDSAPIQLEPSFPMTLFANYEQNQSMNGRKYWGEIGPHDLDRISCSEDHFALSPGKRMSEQ